MITHTILPVITLPERFPGDTTTTRLGDGQLSAFLSPANPKERIWGVRTIAQAATLTDPELGAASPIASSAVAFPRPR
jgi:hypothetical protein